MTYNWQAILGGLVGGVLAGLVAGYATTQVLPAASADYSVTDMLWAAVVAAVGGVLGVAAGWLVNARRARGLGGIAALTSLLGSVIGTYAWARVVGPLDETGLFVVGGILMLGGGLIMLAAVCGLTAALLRVQSPAEERPARA